MFTNSTNTPAGGASSSEFEGDAPYTPAEKEWLEKHWGGEYKFLQSYLLSIYKEEDRAEGRAIVRAMMKHD